MFKIFTKNKKKTRKIKNSIFKKLNPKNSNQTHCIIDDY